jgi:hypothetical protein
MDQQLISRFSDSATGPGGISNNTFGGLSDKILPIRPNIQGGLSNKNYKISKMGAFLYWGLRKEAEIAESACQCNPLHCINM